MSRVELSQKDIEQIREHGLTVEEVERQVAIFEKGAPFADLDRPCTIGDGIKQLSDEQVDTCIRTYEEAVGEREILKFVPASGAATRMFKALLKVANDHDVIQYGMVAKRAEKEGGEYRDVLEFMDNIDRFAFFKALGTRMQQDGLHIDELRQNGDFTEIIQYMLSDKGLAYADTPKGLILFHDYPAGARTPFEEHLVEAAAYSRDDSGKCRLHFTVSEEHRPRFEKLLRNAGGAYEKEHGVNYEVGFSEQSPATDTIAVDMENRPFRDKNGDLLFRPGGHGALIDNVNRLGGDVIFIKNVDNVVPDRLKGETYRWKKALGGYLVMMERKIGDFLERLSGDDAADEKTVNEAMAFVRDELCIGLPEELVKAGADKKREFLIDRLKRPLRVCGMVPSSGEPGGGPFWVKDDEGGASIQIVENAQIDPDSSDQQSILKGLTHFNPVDIVASVRDRSGNPYDLRQFIDPTAVFISHKSKDGRELKALEHPGLWNGGMARWNTIFVEVPLITFNPVKTVNDLLRDEHQG